MKPSIGRIVVVKTVASFNGATEHPAIITRVWGTNDPADAKGASVCINVSVLPDNTSAVMPLSSISLFETKAEAEAAGHATAAWWPERV